MENSIWKTPALPVTIDFGRNGNPFRDGKEIGQLVNGILSRSLYTH